MHKKNILKGLLLFNIATPIYLGLRNSVKVYKDFIPFSHVEGETVYGKEAFSKTIRMYIFNIIMIIFLPIIIIGDFIYDLKHPRYRAKRRK